MSTKLLIKSARHDLDIRHKELLAVVRDESVDGVLDKFKLTFVEVRV